MRDRMWMFCTCGDGGKTRKVLGERVRRGANQIEMNRCMECGRLWQRPRLRKAPKGATPSSCSFIAERRKQWEETCRAVQ
jgi:hypothetical protein